ncbi:hsp70-binding protein 1 [Biomphalaria pfeifferi]|uniref:Hsp70-binding protein 1 n=1 Tax=Biomphalaria pfeifferi TaxID=112525 RepID=A0AAD8B4X9_BIOPF|nr:hsp70-binding protein 1 [Biomphalaria pfeifferi]
MSSEESGGQNGRAPKNLKGLLRFCMEATRSEDAPNSSEIMEPMSEDRRKWLEEALTSMSVNPVERMNSCVKAIQEAVSDTEEGTEQQIMAVSELQDWGEDLDIAGDFIKINGLCIVPKLLSSEVSELRWRCLELLGNLSQNNPVAQTALLTLKLLPVFLHMIDSDPNPTVQIKALYAVSCLVRNNSDAQTQLLAHDGLPVLLCALHSEEEKLRVKATFMISSICSSNPALKDSLVEVGVVEKLVTLLKGEEHGHTHEHILSALLTIVTDHVVAWNKCCSGEMGLKTFLTQRIQFLEGKEQFKEEKEYAEQLLQVLNTKPDKPNPTTRSSSSQLMLAI